MKILSVTLIALLTAISTLTLIPIEKPRLAVKVPVLIADGRTKRTLRRNLERRFKG